MSDHSKLNITRRSFLFGGSAALIGGSAALSLSGCNRKKGSSAENGSAPILAAVAYSDTQISPVGNTNALGRSVLWHICEGLYNIDFHTFKTYNGLAALSPKKINDYTYDVILRENAQFSNGQSVMPEDVIKSFKDNMANDAISPFLSFIKDITSRDDKTITFTLKYPFENLIEQRLACVFIYPASMSLDELKKNPIGSGPWALKSFDGNNGGKIEFTNNLKYEGKYPASSDSMVWNVLLDNTSRTTALNEKTVHAIESVPDLNAGQITSSGAAVEYEQTFGCGLLMFNCLKEPFNDRRVRQAIHYAINEQQLIDVQLDGHAQVVTSFLPKNHPNYHRASNVFEYNPDKAIQLLNEAGISNLNCTLTLNTNWIKNFGPQIQADLKAVGINCELDVKTIPWNQLKNADNGVLPFDMILNPSDPSVFGNDVDLLMSYWYGDNMFVNGISCWKKSDSAQWSELQDLFQAARQADNSSTQQTIWNRCFDIIAEHCPMYPLFHRELGTGYWREGLTNFKPINTTGLVFLGASAKELE